MATQSEAEQAAFEAGQAAWRDNKNIDKDNPHHKESAQWQFWRQGWEEENNIHHK